MTSASLAIAQSTRAELTRQPGVLLTTCGLTALLLVLHDMSAEAFDASGGLARELSLSTASLYAAVLGGIYGARCTAPGGDLSPSLEIFATDITRTQYVAGRLLGVSQGIALQLIVLALAAWIADVTHGGDGQVLLFAMGAVAALLQGCLFAALGALVGTVAPTAFAVTLMLVAVIAVRWVGATPPRDGFAVQWLGGLLPDSLRLDVAREIGFGKPLSAASVALAWASALLQFAALSVLASVCLRRDRT